MESLFRICRKWSSSSSLENIFLIVAKINRKKQTQTWMSNSSANVDNSHLVLKISWEMDFMEFHSLVWRNFFLTWSSSIPYWLKGIYSAFSWYWYGYLRACVEPYWSSSQLSPCQYFRSSYFNRQPLTLSMCEIRRDLSSLLITSCSSSTWVGKSPMSIKRKRSMRVSSKTSNPYVGAQPFIS